MRLIGSKVLRNNELIKIDDEKINDEKVVLRR